MTIYALSTGPGVSGIAVLRVSGKATAEVVKRLTCTSLPAPRVATFSKFSKNLLELIKSAILTFQIHK